jgi:hypothetical protein
LENENTLQNDWILHLVFRLRGGIHIVEGGETNYWKKYNFDLI